LIHLFNYHIHFISCRSHFYCKTLVCFAGFKLNFAIGIVDIVSRRVYYQHILLNQLALSILCRTIIKYLSIRLTFYERVPRASRNSRRRRVLKIAVWNW